MTWNKKMGNHRIISGYQLLNLNRDASTIRFKVKVDGYLFAYVVGDFNHWRKEERYKLEWFADTNDGSLAMRKDISFDETLQQGIHQYSYLLIDTNGDESLLSAQNDVFKPFDFNWEITAHPLEIKSTENVINARMPFEIIAVKNVGNNRLEIMNVEWEIIPSHPGIKFYNRILTFDSTTKDIHEITVKATHQLSGLQAERTFEVGHGLHNRQNLIHFVKRDGAYSGTNFDWDLWTYDDGGKDSKPLPLKLNSDFGVIGATNKVNVIARKKIWDSGWYNAWSEQTPVFNLSPNHRSHFIIHGDDKICTSLVDVVDRMNPRIEFAIMDNKDKIIAYLSDPPPIGTSFDLYINSVKQDGVNTLLKEDQKQVIFLGLPVSPLANDFLVVKSNNNSFLPRKVTMRGYLDKFYYTGSLIGIYFLGEKINLRLWAPTAKQVEVLVYNKVETDSKHPDSSFMMQYEAISGTHQIQISAQFENKYYMYRLLFDNLDEHGRHCSKTTYAVDPYAPGVGLNGDKGVLVNINSSLLVPENWSQDAKPPLLHKQDAVLYEMHLRDFTIKPSSGVRPEIRGKFIGAVELDTCYTDHQSNESVTTGLDSLVELGITHVHLLPVFDFSSVDETKLDDEESRNWGYDPKNYNVPDGSYSIDPYDPTLRIMEVRKMVQKFHQKGIRVVMDMVYNHMTNTTNMDNIVPGYYFRSDNKGKFTNGSGCGNEVASERPMVQRFILDSIEYWIKNYKIDGLRFDLMELMDFDTMKKIVARVHAIDPTILIYGEPWAGGDSPLTNRTYRGRQKNSGFAIFNDLFRDAIRGSNSPSNGFINGDQHNPLNLWHVIEGNKGSINGLTAHASESINYIDAHDNYTLWDQVEKSQNQNLSIGEFRQNLPNNIFDSSLVRQNMLGLGIILTAQGIPFFQGGAEILRTKNGDCNSYKSSDEVNAFFWQDKLQYKKVFDYVKGLIALRRNHPAFRMSNINMINEHLKIYPAHNNDKSGVIIAHYTNNANSDAWAEIIVIYNATAIDNYDVNEILCKPKKGYWDVVVNHEKAGIEPIISLIGEKIPLIKSHSMMVIHN